MTTTPKIPLAIAALAALATLDYMFFNALSSPLSGGEKAQLLWLAAIAAKLLMPTR